MDGTIYSSIDSEDAKSETIKAAKISVQVAKTQRNYLLETFLKMFLDFDEAAFESLSHWFLNVPNEADIWLVIELLKKYFVVLSQMVEEDYFDENYHEAVEEAKFQVSQLIEYLILILSLDNNTDIADEIYPSLPEDLKTDSMSTRQRRDYLVIRDYGRLLNLVENLLQDYC